MACSGQLCAIGPGNPSHIKCRKGHSIKPTRTTLRKGPSIQTNNRQTSLSAERGDSRSSSTRPNNNNIRLDRHYPSTAPYQGAVEQGATRQLQWTDKLQIGFAANPHSKALLSS
tara:strand:- start:1126 stop:1467 length:342 start_codon:yes stop_codon:yes gene_type:complete